MSFFYNKKKALFLGQKWGVKMNLELWKKIKKEKKLTIEDISKLANLPKGSVQNIFCGYVPNPRTDTVEAIEKALGLDKVPKTAFEIGRGHIPLVGQVVAGVPVETSEYLESYITVDYPHPEEYFALRVNGESMIGARIYPNDILIVHKQNYAENGDIVVVAVNGESTVKRYRVIGEHIFLMPENSKFEPIPITDKSNLFIFGKVVRVMLDV